MNNISATIKSYLTVDGTANGAYSKTKVALALTGTVALVAAVALSLGLGLGLAIILPAMAVSCATVFLLREKKQTALARQENQTQNPDMNHVINKKNYLIGYHQGSIEGHKKGVESGYHSGVNAERLENREAHLTTLQAQFSKGFDEGCQVGLEAGRLEGHKTGFNRCSMITEKPSSKDALSRLTSD